MSTLAQTLLTTKLYIPRLRQSHVSRPHLLAALDAGLDRKLIVVAAAAGFGKTMLAAEWSHHHPDEVAWLALDEGDNDPTRFLAYLIAAIQTRRPPLGQELLAALQSPQPPPLDHVLHSLINQLAALHTRLLLILDDYHVIDNTTIHSALAFLVDHAPPQMTLVLLSRADPPLPLARWRARHELLELRAAALRFSIDDARLFLNQTMELDLAADAIQALERRTEGWIAGLQLAALAMQTQPGDKSAFVRHFTGSQRFILDYLMEEVLSRQPAPVRRFLLHTSILHRLSGALCDAVTGGADGQTRLEQLERANLFIIPLDQSAGWYRYHHLFADLLQARLLAEAPGVIQESRLRAAHWLAANNLAEEAVPYALAAKEYSLAADLILGPAASVTRRGEVTTLLDWYRAFPADYVARHPRLQTQFGLAFALGGRWDEAEALLAAVEQATATSDQPPGAEASLMLAYLVASHRQDLPRLTAIAAEARRGPLDPSTQIMVALVTSLSGDLSTACHLLAEAQTRAEQAGDVALAQTALFHRCRFHVFLGDLRAAFRLSQQALHQMSDLGGGALPMALLAHASLGRIFIEWNTPDQAEPHLQQMIRLSELSGFVTGSLSTATMMLAEVKHAQGDFEGALATAQTALAHAQRYDPPAEVEWLKTYQARLWLAQGNVTAAADWRQAALKQTWAASMFYPSHIVGVTQARVLLALRQPAAAITLLTELLKTTRSLLTVEIWAVLALARQALGDSVHAMLALEQALTLAEADNRVRAFLDLGSPMSQLLTRFCEGRPDDVYARTLLAAFPLQPAETPLVEPLRDRELAVLRLIVAGLSNDEIAQRLVVSVSTVKWYVNEIYAKLHVKTRGQAIARAHALRLLD